jgi:hypothetical protein
MNKKLRLTRISLPFVLIAMSVSYLLVVEGLALWSMYTTGVPNYHLYETISATYLDDESLRTTYGYDDDYKDRFVKLLKRVIPNGVRRHTIEEAVEVRESLLNQGSVKGERLRGGPIDLLEGISGGARLLCGELATLYGYTLETLGFKVRNMEVRRSIFDPWDAHSTIEIWDVDRKKWVLSDPTFNVSFSLDGRYLSSGQLYQAVHSGRSSEVRVVKGKKTTYEYSLDEYYISYFSLFDNLFYITHVHLPDVFFIPPLRFFDQRRVIKLVLAESRAPYIGELKVQNAVVWLVYVVNPLVIVVLTWSLIITRRRVER